MKKLLVLVVCAAAGLIASSAVSSAPPVGPLPPAPLNVVQRAVGDTFAITLPEPDVAGGAWRVARAYDDAVVRELSESTTAAGGVRSVYRAIGPGITRLVFAVTRGETAHAYAARTFAVRVSIRAGTSRAGCPKNLLRLTANPIGPSVIAALVRDEPRNRPQVTGATIASDDTQRGPQVKAQCGVTASARTVVVYITDRALLPSQSLTQRVLFVGRTKAGYRVWQRAH